jgi:hypothetical protein
VKLKKARSDRYYIESKDKVDKVYGNINDLRDLVEQIEEELELESQRCITFNNIDKVNFIK